MMNKPPHLFDAQLWTQVLTSKQTQALAWKIERSTKADDEARQVVKLLVETWAELAHVRRYFPDLADVFNPEAIFNIEYARRIESNTSYSKSACVYWILTEISNRPALLFAKSFPFRSSVGFPPTTHSGDAGDE